MPSPSFQSQLDAGLAVLQSLAGQAQQIERIAATVRDALLAGHMLFTCGNGGSATDAQHLAEELIGRYRANRRALPAIALTAARPGRSGAGGGQRRHRAHPGGAPPDLALHLRAGRGSRAEDRATRTED